MPWLKLFKSTFPIFFTQRDNPDNLEEILFIGKLRKRLFMMVSFILVILYSFFLYGHSSSYYLATRNIIGLGVITIFVLLMAKIITERMILSQIQHLQDIDHIKSEFVSLASHQLRTPLSIINLYSSLILAENKGNLNKDQKKYVKEIDRGGKRMAELIDTILNVSKIELGTFSGEPKPTQLTEIVDTVLKEFIPQIKSKEIELAKHYDKELPLVDVDPKLISVVFQNLLSNSLKYTPYKGRISVSIKKERGGKEMVATVADTGCGIPKYQQANIFTKMFRADNAKKKITDGTGLGLYIVKAIVDKSNGKIWFESEENRGAKFFISLPSLATTG